MPLHKGAQPGSKEFGENIATEIKAGKPPKQAEAIAYSEARQHKDDAPTVPGSTIPSYQVEPGLTVKDFAQRAKDAYAKGNHMDGCMRSDCVMDRGTL